MAAGLGLPNDLIGVFVGGGDGTMGDLLCYGPGVRSLCVTRSDWGGSLLSGPRN